MIERTWKLGVTVNIIVVNVYCYGPLGEYRRIWDDICEIRKNHVSKIWFMVGDFNSIRLNGERKGLSSFSIYNREIHVFNNFIEQAELMDIPMVGRRYTWHKPNGTVKSRIDRILVSSKWL